MKDQYFGDLNDYRKYGLLRAIVESTGLRLGVCWMRTANDDRRDGEFRRYLTQARWRRYDPDLYDRLRRLLAPDVDRTVLHADSWGILPTATYHHDLLSDSEPARRTYFDSAWRCLREAAIVFVDPDNGLEIASVRRGARGSARYVYWDEVCDGYGRGHTLIIYQHFPRVRRDVFVPATARALRAKLPDAAVTSFTAGNVAYFIAVRPEHQARFRAVDDRVRLRWAAQIVPAPFHETRG